MSELKALVVRLKSGEYDGVDIMQAWIAIESIQSLKAEVEMLKEQSIVEIDLTAAWKSRADKAEAEVSRLELQVIDLGKRGLETTAIAEELLMQLKASQDARGCPDCPTG